MAKKYVIMIEDVETSQLTNKLFRDLSAFSVQIKIDLNGEQVQLNFFEHDDELSFGLTILDYFSNEQVIEWDGLADYLIDYFVAKHAKEKKTT